MNVIIDLLGALMIATLLMLMMITFQFQLQDTANRTIFAAQMMTHEQNACNELNRLLALAGIGNILVDNVVLIAELEKFSYQTYWDYKNNVMTQVVNTIALSLSPTTTEVGRELSILQSSSPVYDLGSILYLEDLKFAYYDKNGGALTPLPLSATNRKAIRSIEVQMTFKRKSPTMTAPSSDLRTKVQIRCYMMNCYLKDGM